MQSTDANAAALDYLRRLAESRFWGYITVKFEAGKVVHLRREENLKPSDVGTLPETNRGAYGSHNGN